MSKSKSQNAGAYPLQVLFPFASSEAAASTSSWAITSETGTAYAGQRTTEKSWPPYEIQQSHGPLTPKAESAPRTSSAGSEHTVNGLQTRPPSSAYPLQRAPIRKEHRSGFSIPKRHEHGMDNTFKSGHPTNDGRKSSNSYPLQARPSQVFGGETKFSIHREASVISETDVTSLHGPAGSTKPSKSHVAYPAQAPRVHSPRPIPALPPVSSRQSPTTVTPSGSPFEPSPPKPRHTYPFQASPAPSSKAPNKAIAIFEHPYQEDPAPRDIYRPRTPTAPSSEPSEKTAVSSGHASQENLKHRQPYQFQAATSDLRQDGSRGQSTLQKTKSVLTSSLQDSAKDLPRNIRALKEGGAGKLVGRTIVICLDGTGDKFDADNSNIVHLIGCMKKSDPTQITYYQSGIGTYDGGGLSNGFKAALDMAIGSGLGEHIKDAYHFLMQNYLENDRICLFGFSRGAYTARCLAGMVHKVGLLPAHNVQQLPFAYQYYKDDSDLGWQMSAEFKRTFCMNVSVHFIGVFDSVASVGLIPRTLPLSSTPWNKAKYFRHALALDEHRAKFKAKQFEKKDSTDPNVHWETVAESQEDSVEKYTARTQTITSKRKPHASETADDEWSIEADLYPQHVQQQALAKATDVLEVWFAGGHADVGGGAEKNAVRHKLSQIPLRWMLRQCFECDTGIIFKVHSLAEKGLDLDTLWPRYRALETPSPGSSPNTMKKQKNGKILPISRKPTLLRAVDERDSQDPHDLVLLLGEDWRQSCQDFSPEHVNDYLDSVSRLNDQLVGLTAWWILEVWPIKVWVQVQNSGEWTKKVSINLGRYRAVRDASPNLHWTVQQRMHAIGYKMHVRVDRDATWNTVV